MQMDKRESWKGNTVTFFTFFPKYRMKSLPPTSFEMLSRARQIAKSVGLQYVFVGNVIGENWENTYCPKCSRLLIKRSGYYIQENVIKDGKCPYCGEKIYGVWS